MAILLITSYPSSIHYLLYHDHEEYFCDSLEEIIEHFKGSNDSIAHCEITYKGKCFDLRQIKCFPSITDLEIEAYYPEYDYFDLYSLIDLPNLSSLTLRGCISNLNGIEYCTNITHLVLDNIVFPKPQSRFSLALLSHLQFNWLMLKSVLCDSLSCIDTSELTNLYVTVDENIIDELLSMCTFPKLTTLGLMDYSVVQEERLAEASEKIRNLWPEMNQFTVPGYANIMVQGYVKKLHELALKIARPDGIVQYPCFSYTTNTTTIILSGQILESLAQLDENHVSC